MANQQERADNAVDKNVWVNGSLPLTNDEKLGDPRISYGTGSTAYTVGISESVDESSRKPADIEWLKLATMYNLKEQHTRASKTNAEAPNKVHDLVMPPPEPIDASGAVNIGSK